MEAQAKQQVIERLKQANNILVTVSQDPSVDQLAACIGAALLLNRVNKHATAVFSGKVPSTLEFLQPEKTLETNTDSLRDFIISLDKAKADKLRYKVEDQFVRIFITPYHTPLSEKDLQFAQGDYNVEVVVALGVTDPTHLDAAITAHGKILHDATVISLVAGQGKPPQQGQLIWQEPTASSLSEMIVSMSESFGSNLIDSQMATALLTGIVSETDRFSNQKTSPKVMTMSAQLMAAGANQQLIASKLEPVEVEQKVEKEEEAVKGKPTATSEGVLKVKHDDAGENDEGLKEIDIDKEGNIAARSEEEKAPAQEETPAPKPQPMLPPEEETPDLPATPQPMQEPPAMPGSHTLISPQAPAESQFRADPRENDAPLDPLMDSVKPSTGLLEHGPNIKPIDHSKPIIDPASPSPPADQARDAVAQAYAAASDNPAADAFRAVNDNIVMPQPGSEIKPQAPVGEVEESDDEPPAAPTPPPIPPPITTPQGVVIPPPYSPPDEK